MKLVQYRYVRQTELYSLEISEEFCKGLIEYLKDAWTGDWKEEWITPENVLKFYYGNEADECDVMLQRATGEYEDECALPMIVEDYVRDELSCNYESVMDCDCEDAEDFIEEEVQTNGCTHIVNTPVGEYLEDEH